MVAIASPVAQVADLATLSPTVQAAALGYPATLLGFTPAQGSYWREPGLPFLTHEIWQNAPLGYGGIQLIWCFAETSSHDMAPRFPKGCRVNVAPVYKRKNLVVGRVYLYVYRDADTGEEACQLGRLRDIGGNYLVATFDNNPMPALWLLGQDERNAVRNVYEVTHYVSYPGENEQEGGRRE